DLVDLADGAADRGDRLAGVARRALGFADLRRDLVGRARGLRGQVLDLAGDHREALAGLAGARRLDGGVERQQVGLRRDLADQPDDAADAFAGLIEFHDQGVGLLGLRGRLARDAARLLGAPGDLLDRAAQLVAGGGDQADIVGGVARRGLGRGRAVGGLA